MKIENVDPRTLHSNPWNPNHAAPADQERLRRSLERNGWIRPVLARETPRGLEIVGGQHRVIAAVELGHETVPVVNLGAIDDVKAKEIGLIDNARYGEDDALQLAEVLRDIGPIEEIASFLPMGETELDALFGADVDLDTLTVEGEGDDEDAPPEPRRRDPKTHSVIRLKIDVGNAEWVSETLGAVARDQGFDDSDAAVNAGDALVWALRRLEGEDEA